MDLQQTLGALYLERARIRDRTFIGKPFRRILGREQTSQFLVFEADQLEIEIFLLKRGKFNAKQLVIPAGIQGELIVGENIRTLLGFSQMIQNNDGDLAESELARGE